MATIAQLMRAKISPDKEQRISEMKKDVWIGYERALQIRGELERLMAHPETLRMPCMALIGESNNGKSSILANFAKRHPAVSDPNAEKGLMPVVLVTMPAAPVEARLYFRILELFGVAGSAREPDESMLRRIRILLTHLETKMLIIDEIFNIDGGTHTQHKRILNALKNLSTELQIPVVISGVPKIEPLLNVDDAIASRFKPVFLETWNEQRLGEFAQFIKTIERHYKLANPWQLLTERTLKQLLFFSGGVLGAVVEILQLLAEYAIRSGEEVLEAKHISRDYLDAMGWIPPASSGLRNR